MIDGLPFSGMVFGMMFVYGMVCLVFTGWIPPQLFCILYNVFEKGRV